MTDKIPAQGRPRTTARVRGNTRATGPGASSRGIRSRMQAQRTRDTVPELAVRRLLHADGFRYRVDRAPMHGLRRRADLVFGRARVAVYIDGCFWHSCPEHGREPGANREWWRQKLARNRDRDADTDRRLREAGWMVLRAWEHEDPRKVADRIEQVVRTAAGKAA